MERSSGKAAATAADIVWPLILLVMEAYAAGTRAPQGMVTGSMSLAPGGMMLLTLIRLVLPIPETRRAPSKAFNGI